MKRAHRIDLYLDDVEFAALAAIVDALGVDASTAIRIAIRKYADREALAKGDTS